MSGRGLTVCDIMTRRIYAVAPDTSLNTAARLFAKHHISGAPVIDEEGRPVGVVTQSDLVDPERPKTGRFGRGIYYLVEDGVVRPVVDDAPVADGVVAYVMSPFVLAVSPDRLFDDAVQLMVAENIHRLIVTRADRLVGIVTSMDGLRVMARSRATVPPRG